MEDFALLRRLVDEQVPLTVCPLSNLRLCVVNDLAEHPLKEMLQRGLRATVNSDDPAYFGGYMTENFTAVQEALNLSLEQVAQLGRNAFLSSFLEDREKAAALAKLEHCVELFRNAA